MAVSLHSSCTKVGEAVEGKHAPPDRLAQDEVALEGPDESRTRFPSNAGKKAGRIDLERRLNGVKCLLELLNRCELKGAGFTMKKACYYLGLLRVERNIRRFEHTLSENSWRTR